ncbi:Rv3235 family protein [Kitasatospora sp. NPDC085895]|uniref:Rv3235 family protein n=1 Tax=Kitasatospora sp. NPDC085895 TaxID=3155057 RepID=UPI00344ECE82
MAEHRATAPVHAARHAADPAALPLVRPLVHGPGRVQPRRPVRHPHPGRHAAAGHAGTPDAAAPRPGAGEPRPPRRPRSQCAPSRGAGQGDLAVRFAHRLVEVLTGVRPVGQLQRHTTLQGYQQLAVLVRTGPLRPRGRAPQPRLGRVHDSAPAPDALEVCVRVEFGPRHHMVAFRLERHRRTEQWQCAAVEAR